MIVEATWNGDLNATVPMHTCQTRECCKSHEESVERLGLRRSKLSVLLGLCVVVWPIVFDLQSHDVVSGNRKIVYRNHITISGRF